jgi:hypothetical protein
LLGVIVVVILVHAASGLRRKRMIPGSSHPSRRGHPSM